jgi:hypothetical protein
MSHRAFITGALICMVCALGAVPQPRELARGRQPQATVDPRGTIHVTYADDHNTIWMISSSDGGNAFGEPARVITLDQKLALGMRRGPRVAASGNAIAVTYIAGQRGGGKDENVYAVRSTDGGKTWSEPRQINATAGSAREGLHALASDSNGALLCVWLDLRDGPMQVWGALSIDAGKTWGENVRIYRAPDGSICDCCHPSVASDGKGGWLVMFRNHIAGNRDMYIVKSTDGLTWSDATKLGSASWKLPGCPMDGGAIATGKEGAIAAYRRQSELFTCAIDDATKETKIAQGASPAIVVGAGGPTVAYLTSPMRGDLMIATGSDVTKLAEQANDPVLILGHGGPLAIWESNGRVYTAVLVNGQRP